LCEIAYKIEISRKFGWKIFDPDPRPPRFQTRLTPLCTRCQPIMLSNEVAVSAITRLDLTGGPRVEHSCYRILGHGSGTDEPAGTGMPADP